MLHAAQSDELCSGSTAATDPLASGSRPEGSTGPMFSQLAGTTVPPQIDPVFMNSAPITTVQGGSSSGFPIRWDPVTRFGMPPGFFTPSTTRQSTSPASIPTAHQQNIYRFHSRWYRIGQRPSRRDRIQHRLCSQRLSSRLLR